MITSEDNPSIQADEIRYVVARGLREGTLTLYEGYQLQCEAIRIDRIAYTQSAWGRQLSISGLLAIVMHAVTEKALGLHDAAIRHEQWYVNDFHLLGTRRHHFLTDKYPGIAGWLSDGDFLQLINTLRINYDKLSDDDGPYPSEVFPYHYAAPELVLTGEGIGAFDNLKREVSDTVGDAIVELATGRWGITMR